MAAARGAMPTAPSYWRSRGPRALLLYPLSLLFGLLAALRRRLYRAGLLSQVRLPVKVIVVGNIAVGGSGKTPVVAWLVEQLRAAGWHPGIISRGHGGSARGVLEVVASGDAGVCGDEPLLLARLTGVPVFVGRDRPAAAAALLQAHPECDVIVSDDGMQHYRLARDLELAVVDPATLGNRWLLPAGPLREPVRRLDRVDLVIRHGDEGELPPGLGARAVPMRLVGDGFRGVADPARRCDASAFRGRRVHAVAGIGRPQRFFDQLAAMGLDVVPHPFPDHHRFVAADLDFAPGEPKLMTSKDAVKCAPFAPADAWEFPVTAEIGSGAAERILERLQHGRPPA
ncbi:tetraacyldisaccharide 4'-kinase [Azoarcus olearius]|uniref:tetraacyldisaccharide 4'-kinase n=1 Tax=Azoarcus sp. (strain BH72) TaxID=418699 RepID=UPI0008063FF5|nr:tetraacyldisaccharide 4'-kinase [Azoarcus olearius]ANQ84637.1 tetraacyldisaccharide 4'-kinase [Azoarcus olearius]